MVSTLPNLTLNKILELSVQPYERYLPSAFSDEMTMLQKVNKVIEILQSVGDNNNTLIDNWNTLVDWVQNGGVADDVATKLDQWLQDGTLSNLTLSRFLPVGDNAIKTKDSLYIPNDANLFGYKSDGTFANMVTMEQNDVLKVGDSNIDIFWLVANNYHSLRAPNSPSYQKTDSTGAPVDAGRTIKHQGNSSNHLRVYAVGDHLLTSGIYTDLHTLTNVQGQFPPNSYNNFAYIIPREGMYEFNLQLKIKTAPLAKGMIRIAISNLSAGVETLSDICDLPYDPTMYGTPFLNTTFMWKFKKDDQVIIKAQPLVEDITITEGTRLQLYGLGDTIQA